ncbi:MAG TPA: uroporphyrinogen decarboxylase [Actinomycetota bacterium]
MAGPMDDLFLRACRRAPVERTPVWFMRQAGRYQPEYRALRERHGILEICRTPELAAQVTALPVAQLGVDAAILFSDIMVPVAAMGASLEIVEGRGPVIDPPVRSADDLGRLHALEPDGDVPFVMDAVRHVVEQLGHPLIGFAGAPFTLASYLVEGGPSRDYARTKALMWSDPGTWDRLMSLLADSMAAYLRAQVAAGAAAVQLFDSWVGALSEDDYRRCVLPYSARILAGVEGVPRIHFGVGTGHLLEAMRDAGADVVGVDWRTPLDRAWKRVGEDVALQGNLDPAAVLASPEALGRAVVGVLDAAGGRAGHVFNLGHGVLPSTDPAALRSVVDLVREHTGGSP